MRIYVASKSRHWPWWCALRAAGIPIHASWVNAEFNRDGSEPPDWGLHWMVSPHDWSWRHHPQVRRFETLADAIAAITGMGKN